MSACVPLSVCLGPSIYDVHKKITFLNPPPPVHMRPHGPDPLPPCGHPHTVDMKYTPQRTALLKWLVQSLTEPKLKFDYMILIYLNYTFSNLYHQFISQKNFHFFCPKTKFL